MTTTQVEPITQAGGVAIPDRLLAVGDLATIFGVRPATVAFWSRTNRLPRPVRMCRKSYWRPQDIQAFIDGGGETAKNRDNTPAPVTQAVA